MHRPTAMRAYMSITLVALASLILVASCASTKEQPTTPKAPVVTNAVPPARPDKAPKPAGTELKTTELWSDPDRGPIAPVAWSPKGGHIAFVGDGIFVMAVSKRGQSLKPELLYRPTRKEGPVVALFWLDDNRLGWAASHYSEWSHTFSFMQMGMHDSKPKPLVEGSFEGSQNRPSMESPYGGPDDAYYDAGSGTLLFSGMVSDVGLCVRLLSLSTGNVRKLTAPGADAAGWITLCGSLSDPQKPVFYVAAASEDAPGWRLWRSDSYSLRPGRALVTLPDRFVNFPRLSPDGKMLAYVSTSMERNLSSELVLYDLSSGAQMTLSKVMSMWEMTDPMMGCPFSWSPDSKQIAFADGPKLRIVHVPSAISDNTK